jgi:hypothetical protein
VKGISKYPNGTHGTITILFDEAVLPGANGFFRVQDGRFEVKFEASKLWAGKRFFPGNYEVEVQVNPKQQSRSVKIKIEKELGPMAKTKAYRNKYVTIGDKAQRKLEVDKLKDYYVGAIKTAQKLYTDLDKKFRAAKKRFTSEFAKRDKDGKRQVDPKNKNAYLVDEKEFRKHLRDEPNEFYDRAGKFKEETWRNWLDNVWRVEWKRALQAHKNFRGNYVALAWPNQYDQMTTALKMLMKGSIEHSKDLYKWANLPVSKKDQVPDPLPPKFDKRAVLKVIKGVRLKLRLTEYIKAKKAEEEEKKKHKKKDR